MNILTPRKALNKAYLKQKVNRDELETFKKNLQQMLSDMNENESEEYHKNLLTDFLYDTWYKGKHFFNTIERTDLAIRQNNKSESQAAVLIETKKPGNKAEMPSKDNLNVKAMHELIRYYLHERIDKENLGVKHLIVTDLNEFFIFNENDFEKYIYRDKQIRDVYETYKNSGKDTTFFYQSVAKPLLDKIQDKFSFTWFEVKAVKKYLKTSDPNKDIKLIPYYKLLSPPHLLKQPFANDSNTLDQNFYNELLHIIGLKEVKKGSKKLIQRVPEKEMQPGALIENAITELEYGGKFDFYSKKDEYGDTKEEQLFSIALELVITWINRILFLKLLEAQLVRYHRKDESYKFLNLSTLPDYDELNKLFFQILAVKPENRKDQVKDAYSKIPYLNSSLFDPNELEGHTITINNLENQFELIYYTKTVLKNNKGKRRAGKLNSLQYLFEFLDAYDFASEGSEDIQEENKNLINASVLGLIFEKINGYKDGSFFTPGFITEYMARETIRRAVVQKFNKEKGWKLDDFEALKEKIDIDKEGREEANRIINRLKICDPAVGSGHFLVSALNEMIALKSELNVLSYRDGSRMKLYSARVENDELIIEDNDEGVIFDYNLSKQGTIIPEKQTLQEAIFHEKQTIIENCLFGVDINVNSVKICRLRLWIELLKSAYYNETKHTSDVSTLELQTLPNIDINIKTGNSLISRYALDDKLFKRITNFKNKLNEYKYWVKEYKNATDDKQLKKQLNSNIKRFIDLFNQRDPQVIDKENKLTKKTKEYLEKFKSKKLFELKDDKEVQKQKEDLQNDINKLTEEIEYLKKNRIYENAFEWRFEFPEVLNENGDFIGFDIVIGNPPYMRIQELQASYPKEKQYYERTYENATAAYDIANLFFELAIKISAETSQNSYIFPHKFLNSRASKDFRDFLIKGEYIDKLAHFGANMVFDDADTYTCIALFNKKPSNGFWFQRFPFKSNFQELLAEKENYVFTSYESLKKASKLYGSNQWILFDHEIGIEIFEKLYKKSKKLEDFLKEIFVGLQTSKDKLYVLESISDNDFELRVPLTNLEYKLEPDLFKPFLMGKDVHRYSKVKSNKYVFFPYKLNANKVQIIPIDEIAEKYPLTYNFLIDHEKYFKARENKKAAKMKYWYSYIYPKNLNKFEQPKLLSMEICVKHPNVTIDREDYYHTTKVYSWIKKENVEESYEYLLAIANSKLLWWFLKNTGDTLQGDARTFKTNYLNPYPIPRNVSRTNEEKIKEKVQEVINIKQQDPTTDTSALEAEIDRMVYDLYRLTEEEREIVEESVD